GLFISTGLSSGSCGCSASVAARPSHMKPPPAEAKVTPSGFAALSLYGGVGTQLHRQAVRRPVGILRRVAGGARHVLAARQGLVEKRLLPHLRRQAQRRTAAAGTGAAPAASARAGAAACAGAAAAPAAAARQPEQDR